ncbi:MAG: NfeD family protein [Bacilli bacterium]|nr:NfeD family protein [Bacilli bacterium]
MIWFALIFVFLIIEAITLNLVTIWFAFGSICAYITSYFTENIIIQLIVFVITSAVSLLLTKPLVEKYFKKNKVSTNFDRIIGQIGIVTKTIKKHEGGRVKIDGKDWMAISDKEIKNGSEVEILKIEGAKIIVRKKEK